MKRVLVTGANGFVGRCLCRQLGAAGVAVRAVVRRAAAIDGSEDVRVMAQPTTPRAWSALLDDVDGVVHLAALTHAGGLDDARAWSHYAAVNIDITRALVTAVASSAAEAMVLMSSIKVNGERSPRIDGGWQRLSGRDSPNPQDNYGRSKWQAEQLLTALPAQLRTTVLRPPLVYGPGMKGNLPRLFGAVLRRVPLPLAALDNCRSLVGVHNLADAVVRALGCAPAGIATYTLADIDLSTPGLVRAIARALGVTPHLWRCPPRLLNLAGRLGGRAAAVERLAGSLVVESDSIGAALGWRPATTFECELQATADWYRRRRAGD